LGGRSLLKAFHRQLVHGLGIGLGPIEKHADQLLAGDRVLRAGERLDLLTLHHGAVKLRDTGQKAVAELQSLRVKRVMRLT
jgi:hypothetical protein